MLTALLLFASAASLSGDVARDAPYRARLLAQADLPAATVNRGALEAERTRILDARPSLGFPIAMMSIGGGSTFLFVLITAALANSSGYYYTVPGEVYAVMGILIAASLGVVALGIVSLIFRLSERKQSEPRLNAIDAQLQKGGPRPAEDLNPLPPGPPPGPPPPIPDQPPGPPPPPPPPLAMLTLATF